MASMKSRTKMLEAVEQRVFEGEGEGDERIGGSAPSHSTSSRFWRREYEWVEVLDYFPPSPQAGFRLRRMNTVQIQALCAVRVHEKVKVVCRRSLFLFPLTSIIRQTALMLVEWRVFDRFILFCIFLNSVMLGMYQYRATEKEDHWWVNEVSQGRIVEILLLAIFSLESCLKIIAWGLVVDKCSYLQDPWNVLDFVVVISGLLEEMQVGGKLNFLRLFRLLRPLRSLNSVPQLKILVSAMLGSIKRLGNVVVLGGFLFAVFGIVGLQLMTGVFYHQCRVTKNPLLVNGCWSWNVTDGDARLCGGNYNCESGGFCMGHHLDWDDNFRPIFVGGPAPPEVGWCDGSEPTKVYPETDFVHFDHIGGAILLIFQSMTLEGWTELMYMVEDAFSPWFSWIFFIGIIILTNFFLTNVALAVVDEVQDASRAESGGDEDSDSGNWLIPDDESDTSSSPSGLRTSAQAKSPLGMGTADVDDHRPSVTSEGEEEMVVQTEVVSEGDSEFSSHNRGRDDDLDLEPEVQVGDDLWYDCTLIRWCQCIAANALFQNCIMLAITGNVVNMCLSRFSLSGAFGWGPVNDVIDVLELIFLAIFIVEMFIMIAALGPCGYIKNKVTAFDGTVVVFSVAELAVSLANDGKGNSGLSSLRTFRLFRMMNKLASLNFPLARRLKCLLKAVVRTGNSLKYWLVLFALLLYIATLIGMTSFAKQFHFENADDLYPLISEDPARDADCPESGCPWCPKGSEPFKGTDWHFWQECIPRAHFDTFTWGMVTVFQVMTGENWNTIMYAGMRASERWTNTFGIPPEVIAAGIFVIMILFGQILFMSLFLSMLISKFDEVQDEYKRQEEAKVKLAEQEKGSEGKRSTGFGVATTVVKIKQAVSPSDKKNKEGSTDTKSFKVRAASGSSAVNDGEKSQKSQQSEGAAGESSRTSAAGLRVNNEDEKGDTAGEDRNQQRMYSGTSARSGTSSESAVHSAVNTTGGTTERLLEESSKISPTLPGCAPVEHVALPGQLTDSHKITLEKSKCCDEASNECQITSLVHINGTGKVDVAKPTTAYAYGPEETDVEEQAEWKGKPASAKEEEDTVQVSTRSWPTGYACFILSEENPVRKAALWSLSKQVMWGDDKILIFDNFILVCILVSTLCMMIDTPLSNPEAPFTQVLRLLDTFFSIVFIVEMVVKLTAYGLICGKDAYLTNGWNWLDGSVVCVSLIDLLPTGGDAGFLRVLRILRTFRPLRIISRWQGLRVVVQAIFQSIGDLASLSITAFLFLLIFSLFFLMYLRGSLYHCTPGAQPVGYLGKYFGDLGEDFTTPLCLPEANVTFNSASRGTFVMVDPGGGTWKDAPAGCDSSGSTPRPLEWRRVSVDTPICVARCDPSLDFHPPGIEDLCHRKYAKTEELPDMCGNPNRIPLFAEEEKIGRQYVEDMQRTLVVPCGGFTLSTDEQQVVNTGGAVSCKSSFCPDVGDPPEGCVSECRSHQYFCADTCTGDEDNSVKCNACRRECESACACKQHCTPLIKDAALCHEQGGDWSPVRSQNFDTIESALLSLFEISTTEGWVDVMYAAADAVGVYRQPIRDYSPAVYVIFFPLWIVVSNFFVLNLVVGVIVDNFMSARSENNGSSAMMTEGQSKWIVEAQQKWIKSRQTLHSRVVFFDLENLHLLGPFRRGLYRVISSKVFDHFIMASIILNTVIMACTTFPSHMTKTAQDYRDFQESANYVFATIFTLEAIMKLVALRGNYWMSNWNRFDFLCVTSTLIGIMLKQPPFNVNLGSATSVIRILRIARLFRLLRFMKELDRLFKCLLRSIPKLFNVLMILILFLVLFSVLGMSLFGTAKFGENYGYDEHGNFRTFFRGFVTLLRASTGEAWNDIMHDLAKDERNYFQEGSWCTPQTLFKSRVVETYKVLEDKCLIEYPNACPGSWNPLPQVFWVVFSLLIPFMMLNLVVAVILEGYEEGRGTSETDEVELCIEIWKKYDPDHRMVVPLKDAMPFINEATKALRDQAEKDGASKKSDIGPIPKIQEEFEPQAPEAEDISSLCSKLSLLEWKGKWSMNVQPDNQVTFLSCSRQVFRLKAAGMMDEQDIKERVLDKSDGEILSKRDRERLERLERPFKATAGQQDLLANIAAMKLQRLFRRRKKGRRAHGSGSE